MLDINIAVATFTFLIALFAQGLLVRRHFSGILDPLAYFIITSSFSVTLAATLIDDISILVRVVIYFIFFWLGFLVTTPPPQNPKLTNIGYRIRKDSYFSIIVATGVLIVVIANIFAWQRVGIPVFSTDPSLQKSESLTDGLGVVRRINWGLGTFLFMGSVFWALFNRSKIAFLCLAVLALVSTFNGSKSALLPMIFALGLFINRPFLNSQSASITDPVRSLSRYALAVAAIPILIVLFIESNGVSEAAIALGTRLLYFGDALLYWSDPDLRQHFKSANPSSSYLTHLFGGVLGAMRLVPYSPPMGNDFVQFSLRVGQEISDALGPNIPFYVKGEVFFGPIFAAAYSAVVGVAVGFFRRLFFQKSLSSLTSYTVFATLAGLSITLPVEDSLMVNRFFDLAIFLIPVAVFSKIIVWATRRPPPTKYDYS